MKVKVKQTTEVEVDLKFPLFFNHNGLLMAILNEKESIYITSDSITQTSTQILLEYYNDSEQITAEEFTRVFDERIEQLQSLKSHFFTNK